MPAGSVFMTMLFWSPSIICPSLDSLLLGCCSVRSLADVGRLLGHVHLCHPEIFSWGAVQHRHLQLHGFLWRLWVAVSAARIPALQCLCRFYPQMGSSRSWHCDLCHDLCTQFHILCTWSSQQTLMALSLYEKVSGSMMVGSSRLHQKGATALLPLISLPIRRVMF